MLKGPLAESVTRKGGTNQKTVGEYRITTPDNSYGSRIRWAFRITGFCRVILNHLCGMQSSFRKGFRSVILRQVRCAFFAHLMDRSKTKADYNFLRDSGSSADMLSSIHSLTKPTHNRVKIPETLNSASRELFHLDKVAGPKIPIYGIGMWTLREVSDLRFPAVLSLVTQEPPCRRDFQLLSEGFISKPAPLG